MTMLLNYTTTIPLARTLAELAKTVPVPVVAHFALLVAVIAASTTAWPGDSTYALTLAGKKCSESQLQPIECTYVVGKDLEFTIAAVGQPYAGVHFLRSSFAGDYYASFGLNHGCVIVRPGEKSVVPISNPQLLFAFVSPRNGKVYSSWEQCKGGL